MKLYSTIILLAATADARRRKKNKNRNEEVEESSGEGSGVDPVTADEAVLVVDQLVDDLVAVADAAGESTKALSRRIDHLKTSKSSSQQTLIKNPFSWSPERPTRHLLSSLRR